MDESIRILVVDDEQELCSALRGLLELEGYDVECAYDGATALEKAGRQPFHLVLTDIMLPDTDGLELCRCLREQHGDVMVIVMTAYSSLHYALEYGASDYLVRSFQDLGDLLHAIQRGVAGYKKRQRAAPDRDGPT